MSIFRDLYKYQVEHWEIPDEDSDLAATEKVIACIKEVNGSDNLLIVSYAGHATIEASGSRQIWWAR